MRASLLCVPILLAGCAGAPAVSPAPVRAPAADPPACGEPERPIAAADVAIAIDTSLSTLDATRVDVDGDGRLGALRHSEMTDPDDSVLAAQVAGVRSLLRAASPAGPPRFAIVTFAGGDRDPWEPSASRVVAGRDAELRAGLTADLTALDAALDAVLARGARGKTSFAPAMRLALRALTEAPPGPGSRRRVVLLLSDSPTPVRIGSTAGFRFVIPQLLRHDSRIEAAARDAIAGGVAVHTFGLGAAAFVEPPHVLSRIAGATGGSYRAVRDPRGLACELLAALAR